MTLKEIAQQMHDDLQRDEVLLRFYDRAKRGKIKNNRPVTVLDFLAEQRVVALSMLQGVEEMRLPPMQPRPTNELRRWIQVALGVCIRQAIPFLWTHEMRLLALQYQVPDHTIGPSAFPHEVMWWTFETAIGIAGTDRHTDGLLIVRSSYLEALQALTTGSFDGWVIVEIGSEDGLGTSMYAELLGSFPDGTSSSELGEWSALLGMSAFLNSHFVDVSKKRPSDTDKRWHGRRVGDPAALNVVTLRSSVRDAVAVERGEGPQWKQRWLVRGHLRAQWYPSTKSHQIIWIAPYLKGPEDAPLKTPVYRVAR